MAEAATLPPASPEVFSHEEAIEIEVNRQAVDYDLDRIEDLRADPIINEAERLLREEAILEVMQRNMGNDRLYFVAVCQTLGSEDIDDRPEESADTLADALDGPLRVPDYSEQNGDPVEPPADVMTEIETCIRQITNQETGAGAKAHELEFEQNKQGLADAQLRLQHAEQEGNARMAALYRETVMNMSKRLDDMEGTTHRTEQSALDARLHIVQLRVGGATDDAPEMQAALAWRDKVEARAQTVLATNPHFRLRGLLRDYPEAMNFIAGRREFHEMYVTHAEQAGKDGLHARLEALQKAKDELAAVPAEGDFHGAPEHAKQIEAERALAQVKVFNAKQAVEEAAGFVSQEAEPFEAMERLIANYDAAKIAREDQEKQFGELRPLEEEVFKALLHWKEGITTGSTDRMPKPSDEHAVFKNMQQIEAYMDTLDQRMAVVGPGHRAWDTLRQMRIDAFGVYLRAQYIKEQVRADYYDRTGSMEGRNGFAYLLDKGIQVERANGQFVVYPDASYAIINEDSSIGTRLTAWGEEWTAPVGHPDPMLAPGGRFYALYENACRNLSLDELKAEEQAIYLKWFRAQEDPVANMEQAVVARALRERLALEPTPDVAHIMNLAYTEYFVLAGNYVDVRLQEAGTIEVEGGTFHGITGNWILHPTGAAELFIDGEAEPRIYGPDGTIIGEDEEEPPLLPMAPPPPPPAPPSGGPGPSGGAPGPGGAPGAGPHLRPRRENPLFDDDDEDTARTPLLGGVPPRRDDEGRRVLRPRREPDGSNEGRTAADDILGPPPRPRPHTTGGAGAVMPPRPVPTPGEVFGPRTGEAAAGGAAPPPPPGGGEGGAEGSNAIAANRERHRAVEAAAEAAKGSTVIHTSIMPQKGQPVQLKTASGTRKPSAGFQSFGDGYKRSYSDGRRGGPYNVIVEETSPEKIWFAPLLNVPRGAQEPTSDNIPESWKVRVPSPVGGTEPGVKVFYSFEAPRSVKYEAAGGGDPRGGNIMFVRATLPESVANQLLEAVKADPTAARNLAYRLFASNASADLWDGEEGQQAARPPYDVVDRLPGGWNLSVIDDKPGGAKVSTIPFPRG